MNQELSKLKNFLQLCSECEEWTSGSCDICNDQVCDDCFDFHLDNSHDDEEK